MKIVIIKTRRITKGNISVFGFIIVGFFVLGSYKIYTIGNISHRWQPFEKHEPRELVAHVITYSSVFMRTYKNGSHQAEKMKHIGNYSNPNESRKSEIINSNQIGVINILHGFKRDSEEIISVITNSDDKTKN